MLFIRYISPHGLARIPGTAVQPSATRAVLPGTSAESGGEGAGTVQVIETQHSLASVPHDHLHISQIRSTLAHRGLICEPRPVIVG
jgi:hypothetical protein